ncbi:hypothetical protein SAMN05661044_05658 [Olivibacter domesticus]|uniref:Uncharacterized protein n=1 Tax=Olivibacter domesticus TaxID=407022 RepID=A0A1H7ZZ26_OLID1|nr:hypothetical protein SAMN05661044_05658 [Olivibacter domesticus]
MLLNSSSTLLNFFSLPVFNSFMAAMVSVLGSLLTFFTLTICVILDDQRWCYYLACDAWNIEGRCKLIMSCSLELCMLEW